MEQAPLVRDIVKVLRHSDNGAVRADSVRTRLRQVFSEESAHAQLDTAIDWGRYGGLFEYDADSDRLLLPSAADPARPAPPLPAEGRAPISDG